MGPLERGHAAFGRHLRHPLSLLLAATLGVGACKGGPQPEADPAPSQGDAPAAAQRAVPVPLTAARHAELKALAESVLAGQSLTVPVGPRASVVQIIHHFQTDPDARLLMEAALTQAPSFRPAIETALQRDGLPPELSYVAQAESAFLAANLQGKGLAVGLWQMIPSTARHYGLVVNATVDNRVEAFKATDAAVRHLVDLYATFKDWPLAITGFYAGAGIVERGMETSGAKDAWALIEDPEALPRECRGYLPLVYAHAIVSLAPERFGFTGRVSEAQVSQIIQNYEHYYTHRYPESLSFGDGR